MPDGGVLPRNDWAEASESRRTNTATSAVAETTTRAASAYLAFTCLFRWYPARAAAHTRDPQLGKRGLNGSARRFAGPVRQCTRQTMSLIGLRRVATGRKTLGRAPVRQVRSGRD